MHVVCYIMYSRQLFHEHCVCELSTLTCLPAFCFGFSFLFSGDVEKVDEKGMTPLHIAAKYGHMEASEHLVSHGANLFALDNFGQTAAKVAGYYQKVECCRYLDTLAVRWEMQNKEYVDKMKVKAMKELKKRSKAFNEHEEGKSGMGKPKKLSYDYSTAPSGASPAKAEGGKQRSVSIAHPPAGGRKKKLSTQDALRQNFELRPSHSTEHITGKGENEEVDQVEFPHSAGSTFRPIPRVNAGPLLNTLQSLSHSPYTSSEPGLVLHERSSSASSSETSVHGTGILSNASRSTTDLEPLSPQVMEIENNSTLATFLTSLDLLDCVQLLHKEQLDLEALALCDEKDLISIGLPLGPRKKILHAIQRRREVMTNSGRLNDSEL